MARSFLKCLCLTILWNFSQKWCGLLKLWTCMTLIWRIVDKITNDLSCWMNPSGKLWCWCGRRLSRKRWIFILIVIPWRRNHNKGTNKRKKYGRRWHMRQRWLACQRWHKPQIKLIGQDIFIKRNISSNNNSCWIWLKKSITFYIFIVSNKNALLTLRL